MRENSAAKSCWIWLTAITRPLRERSAVKAQSSTEPAPRPQAVAYFIFLVTCGSGRTKWKAAIAARPTAAISAPDAGSAKSRRKEPPQPRKSSTESSAQPAASSSPGTGALLGGTTLSWMDRLFWGLGWELPRGLRGNRAGKDSFMAVSLLSDQTMRFPSSSG